MHAQAGQVEEGVGAALALLLQCAGGGDLGGSVGAVVVTVDGWGQRRGFAGNGQVQVDTVQQRAGEFVAVTLDLLAAAAAAPVRVAQVAAGAGVHRRYQLEARRETDFVTSPGDHDFARFEW